MNVLVFVCAVTTQLVSVLRSILRTGWDALSNPRRQSSVFAEDAGNCGSLGHQDGVGRVGDTRPVLIRQVDRKVSRLFTDHRAHRKGVRPGKRIDVELNDRSRSGGSACRTSSNVHPYLSARFSLATSSGLCDEGGDVSPPFPGHSRSFGDSTAPKAASRLEVTSSESVEATCTPANCVPRSRMRSCLSPNAAEYRESVLRRRICGRPASERTSTALPRRCSRRNGGGSRLARPAVLLVVLHHRTHRPHPDRPRGTLRMRRV